MFDTPEEKAALKAAVDEATAATRAEAEQAATALQLNNRKLLEQLREAKKAVEVDPAKYAALEDKNNALEDQVAALTTTVTARETELKKLAKESAAQMDKLTKETGLTIADLTKQVEAESGFTKSLLVDNGLADSLVKAGVEPAFLPAVKAMLKAQVAIEAVGDVRVAKAGGKPLEEFVSAWAVSEEGRHFVRAPANAGGGATGGVQTAGVTFISASDKTAVGLNLAELAKGTKGTVQVSDAA